MDFSYNKLYNEQNKIYKETWGKICHIFISGKNVFYTSKALHPKQITLKTFKVVENSNFLPNSTMMNFTQSFFSMVFFNETSFQR